MSSLLQAGQSISECQASRALDLLELRMLIMHVCGLSRIQLITQDQRQLTVAEAAQLNDLIAARQRGQPMAYLLGSREFFGLNFLTNPAVLIPRPDTELLVELVLQQAAAGARVLDLGTGSGAIAIALAHSRADLQITAVDFSASALAVAQQNAHQLIPEAVASGRFKLQLSDWFAQIEAQQFDLIVSNPPYIEANDEHLQQGDLRFEPSTALTDGADGLTAYRHIINAAPAWLASPGQIYFEHGYNQAAAVRSLLQQAGFNAVQSWHDLAQIERVSGGLWAGAA